MYANKFSNVRCKAVTSHLFLQITFIHQEGSCSARPFTLVGSKPKEETPLPMISFVSELYTNAFTPYAWRSFRVLV